MYGVRRECVYLGKASVQDSIQVRQRCQSDREHDELRVLAEVREVWL